MEKHIMEQKSYLEQHALEALETITLDAKDKSILDFEKEYPSLAKSFREVQEEQYELFAQKMMSYGRENISLGGNLTNKEDKNLTLTSIWIRMNDKMNRLKNMVVKNKSNPLDNESIEDTWIDISNYSIIALLVGIDKW
jgi:hypothetical protein